MERISALISENTLVVIAVSALAAVAIIGFYYFRTRTGKSLKEKAPETTSTPKPALASEVSAEDMEKIIEQFASVEAVVFDNENRTWYKTELPGRDVINIRRDHSTLGRKWMMDGKWVYAFNRGEGGTYRPVEVPETMKDPPSKLHRALAQQEIDIVFNVDPERGFFQKWGHILLFVGACIFILFLVVMQQTQ